MVWGIECASLLAEMSSAASAESSGAGRESLPVADLPYPAVPRDSCETERRYWDRQRNEPIVRPKDGSVLSFAETASASSW